MFAHCVVIFYQFRACSHHSLWIAQFPDSSRRQNVSRATVCGTRTLAEVGSSAGNTRLSSKSRERGWSYSCVPPRRERRMAYYQAVIYMDPAFTPSKSFGPQVWAVLKAVSRSREVSGRIRDIYKLARKFPPSHSSGHSSASKDVAIVKGLRFSLEKPNWDIYYSIIIRGSSPSACNDLEEFKGGRRILVFIIFNHTETNLTLCCKARASSFMDWRKGQ